MGNPRVRIFVDFWNFQLNWLDYHAKHGAGERRVSIPWKDMLPLLLTAEALNGQPGKFSGIHVYASFDANNKNDKKFHGWLHHTLASFPGYIIESRQRKPRKTMKCQNEECKFPITTCPQCKQALKGTVEKGIDAAIITDLITFAFDDTYDVGVLVSGDADFAPAVRYIQKKTDKQIIQAFFKDHGDELRNSCWHHLFFDNLMGKLVPTAEKGAAGA